MIPTPAGLESLTPLIAQRLAPSAHGDMPRWLGALDALPRLAVAAVRLSDTVCVEGAASHEERRRLERALRELHPWRKGPFSLFGVHIDTEWRSDWKWRRVVPHIASLARRRVLDVGCGNGYFGWRMLEAGAAEVVGVDPTLVFCLQHRAINGYVGSPVNHVLPIRLEELPAQAFDSVFSLGVVYHRRDPEDHVRRLFAHTRSGGQVVLESLVARDAPLVPSGRYARMRNVHIVPTTDMMRRWLEAAGFADARTVDVTPTTADEQRTTPWMRFQSLAAALDPHQPDRTVEGHPAPVRAVVTAVKPVYSPT